MLGQASLVSLIVVDDKDQEPGPVPWRRVYGFAQNSHLLDRGFLFGSATVALVWLMTPFDLEHYFSGV